MPGPFMKNTSVPMTYPQSGHATLRETTSKTWYTSPKDPVTGNLVLKPQVFTYSRRVNMSVWQKPNQSGFFVLPQTLGILTTSEPKFVSAMQSLQNRAYAKLMGKVKSDTASLGMTLGSWRQSWAMVDKRLDTLYSMTKDAAFEARRRNRRGGLLKKESAADVFLENQFGWVPLLQDIYASAKILCYGEDPPGWVKGSATDLVVLPDTSPDAYSKLYGRTGALRYTLAASVAVSNPNLWILNKLGLVNPAQILWDRIPWSFVVGFFANVNQVLNSFTDTVGLSITDVNETRSWNLTDSNWMSNTYPVSHPFYAEAQASANQRFKTRGLLGALPRPKLEVHLPRVDMSKALIASSLVYQQISKWKPAKAFISKF